MKQAAAASAISGVSVSASFNPNASDSAGAVGLVRSEHARDLPRQPVLVQGFAERYLQHATPFGTDDWIDNGVLAEMGRLALDRADLTRDDIDLVQIYDAFTINVLIGLEQLGFCGRGESGAFVQGGRIAPGGEFPMNTSGGGLCFNHGGMFGMPLMIESVRQLRRLRRPPGAGRTQLPAAGGRARDVRLYGHGPGHRHLIVRFGRENTP